jgi:hypothetical protein
MLGGRSANFIIALQNRLSYVSQRRIKALLPGRNPTGAAAPAFLAKRNTPKKANKFNHIEPPSGKDKKSARRGPVTPPAPLARSPRSRREPAKVRDAIDRIWR